MERRSAAADSSADFSAVGGVPRCDRILLSALDMTRRLAVLGIILSLARASSAQMITYGGCVDMMGRPVASVLNVAVPDVAVARLGPRGEPLIFYNPNVLARMAPQTRLFFYAHECAHHALGHMFNGNPMSAEQEADCWGIRTLYQRGLLNDRDVTIVQRDLSFSPGDWTHLPGPPRAFNLRRCLASETSHDAPRGRADACEYANDGACDEPDLCAPGTDSTDCRSRSPRPRTSDRSMCPYANDGTCDEPDVCPPGTDRADCEARVARSPMCCDTFGRPVCALLSNAGPVGSPCGCWGIAGYGLVCQ